MSQAPQDQSGTTQRLERWAPLALTLLFLLAVAGGIALLIERDAPDGIEVVSPTLQVNLTGAVANPGVYTFDQGDRLDAVLQQAGGTTADADLARVNPALQLRDEAHIHVPAVGEATSESAQGNIVSSSEGLNLLNVNTATQEALETLPGIGPVLAKAIIAYRETEGLFTEVEMLLEVNGIGAGTLLGIVDLVVVE